MTHTLSLEQKIGQLFMCGFFGKEPSREIMELIQDYYIGGICYFGRNLEDPEQTHMLSEKLQQTVPHDIPLFISIDQEGGMVYRIEKGVTLSPGNMAIGATGNPSYAYRLAKIAGKELRTMGINMNFAPCVDVNNNPKNPVIGVRSYGENPEMVGQFGQQAIQGYQDGGVSAVAKHFPGHGDTEIDSHLGLPVVDHPLSRLESVELLPFRQAIQQNVDGMMVSHVCFPAIEKGLPATLSKKIITDLLKQEYQFKGIVITDCMEMKAIDNHYGVEEAAVKAVQSGVDIILFSHSYEKQKQAIEAVNKAVQSGDLSEERIDEAVERILNVKRKRLDHQKMDFQMEELAKKESLDVAKKVRDESITIVKDEKGLIPIDPEKKTLVIWPDIEVTSDIDEGYDQKETLGDFMINRVPELTELTLQGTPNKQILKSAKEAEQLIICTYNAASDPEQKKLIQDVLKQTNQSAILCALRSPYDLSVFPKTSTYLAVYESSPGSILSLANILIGDKKAAGKLPVSIPDNRSD